MKRVWGGGGWPRITIPVCVTGRWCNGGLHHGLSETEGKQSRDVVAAAAG